MFLGSVLLTKNMWSGYKNTCHREYDCLCCGRYCGTGIGITKLEAESMKLFDKMLYKELSEDGVNVPGGEAQRIATYLGATIQSWSSKGAVLIQGKYRLEVQLLNQKAQPLRAPCDGNMNRTIHESLCAKVRYRFWHGGKLLFDHIDDHAGFEYAKN